MAGKVNYRFVALLCAILIICAASVVGLWYAFVRTDPIESIARGDGALQAGRYAEAAAHYGKALAKRKTDIDLVLKYADALEPMEVADVRSARDSVQRLQGAYTRALQIQPDHPLALRRLMELTMQIGRELGDFEAWNQMISIAEAALQADAGNVIARQYRGIAQVNRMESLDVAAEDRTQAFDDLEAAAKANPNDTEIAYHLVRWHLVQARKLARTQSDAQQVKELQDRAFELSNILLDGDRSDPLRMLYHIRVLNALQKPDLARQMFDQLEDRLLKDPTPADVALAVADRLAYVTLRPDLSQNLPLGEQGLDRTETLLRTAMQAHPGDLRFPVALGRTLTIAGKTDEALALLEEASSREIRATPLAVLRDADLQRRAMSQHADLLLTQVRTLTGEERDKKLAQVRDLVHRIQSTSGQIALVSLIEGKMHLAKGEWAAALDALDKASAMYKDQNPEALLFSATARIKLGEVGAAIDRLDLLAELRPDYRPARYELMRQHLRLSQFDLLQNQIDAVLTRFPRDFEAHRYQALLMARKGNIHRAITMLEKLDPDANPSLAAPLSQLYVMTNQGERASKMLVSAFAKDPTDPNVLLQLLNVTTDANRSMAFIAKARNAGMADQVLNLLEEKITGKLDQDRIAAIERLIDQDEDIFRRHVNRYRLYVGLGKAKAAEQELDNLTKLDPNDAMVVEARFIEAIEKRNWTVAEQLVQQAAQHDLDLAQGSFFRGRLELARGQGAQAVVSFTRGLSQRKVYSDGWNDLGRAEQMIGDLVSAATSFRRALEINPANVASVRGLISALDAQGKYEQALTELRDRVMRGSDNPQLAEIYLHYEQAHGDARRALAIRRRLAIADPTNTNNLRALAVLLSKLGDLEQARKMIGELLAREGRTRDNLFTAASVLGLSGDPQGARKLLEDHLNQLGDKTTDQDWLMYARFLMRTSAFDEAHAAYRKAIELEDNPQRPATRELADQLFAMGKDEKAAELYRWLYEQTPDDQRVAHRYVEALIRIRQYQLAEKVLSDSSARFQPTASAYLLQSLIARHQNDLPRAVAALDNAAQVEPNRAMVYFERAELRKLVDADDPQIMADLKKAIELDGDLSAARRRLTALLLERDDRSGAIAELIALIERSPRDVSTRVQLAELYFADQQILQLEALLEESARLFADDPRWPRMMGRLAATEGRSRSAAEYFTRAFALSKTADILAEAAEQLVESHQIDEALNLLRENDQMTKDHPRLQAVRGRALAGTGHPEQGVAMFAFAVKNCRNIAQAYAVSRQIFAGLGNEQGVAQIEAFAKGKARPWLFMAVAQREIETKQYAKAESRLRTLGAPPEARGERLEYYRLLALAQHHKGDFAAARQTYESILEIDSDNLSATNNLAYLLAEELGMVSEGLSLATRAAEIAPDNVQVLDTLGWIQHRAGQQEAAVKTLRLSVHLRPTATNCYHLGIALIESGEIRDGYDRLETARKLADKEGNQSLLNAIVERVNP